MPIKSALKIIAGFLISILCIALALRKVNTKEMLAAFKNADYAMVMLSVGVLMISHFFRALRWRILLLPVKPINTVKLFSALVIGYAGNSFLPAHLGEFLRAFVLSKKVRFSMSAILATIVLERLIDVFSLLLVMVVALCVYPGPSWLLTSGYLMFTGAMVLFTVLVLIKRFQEAALTRMKCLLTFGKGHLAELLIHAIERFLSGILPLSSKWHYMYTAILTAAIWACYGAVYYLNIVAFRLDQTYYVPWYATLIILVVTTISIVVPSSPGYIGTFHYLCQLSLVMFGVNAGIALSYATVVHAVYVLPVTIVGLVMANIEGVALLRNHKLIETKIVG